MKRRVGVEATEQAQLLLLVRVPSLQQDTLKDFFRRRSVGSFRLEEAVVAAG